MSLYKNIPKKRESKQYVEHTKQLVYIPASHPNIITGTIPKATPAFHFPSKKLPSSSIYGSAMGTKMTAEFANRNRNPKPNAFQPLAWKRYIYDIF